MSLGTIFFNPKEDKTAGFKNNKFFFSLHNYQVFVKREHYEILNSTNKTFGIPFAFI